MNPVTRRFFFIGVVILGIFALAGLWVWFSKSTIRSVTESTAYDAEYKEGKIVLEGKVGQEILINDIYANPVERLEENAIIIVRHEQFSIDYYPDGQGFLVVLYTPHLQQGVQLMEKEFLRVLGINSTEACQLNVSVNVPFAVYPAASNQSYDLSFCNGSETLEDYY